MISDLGTMLSRILTLAVKEVLTLFRDPKGRLVLIAPPIMQLFLFAYAATLEVKNVHLAIYNEDPGIHSRHIIDRFLGSTTFTDIQFLKKDSDIKPVIDQQTSMVVVHFPQNFSSDISAGRSTTVQLILDGRRSNAAQIVNGYIIEIINRYSLNLESQTTLKQQAIQVDDRNWFNANLLYLWFTIPSLVCILSMLIALVITSLSVARERELGTFEQLLVSPLGPYEILLGKTIPAIIIGLLEGALIWLAGYLFFGVPFIGSFWLMIFTLFAFVFSIVGVGLFISAMSKTQQQAVLGTFIFMVPAVTLSGYASPIENMPVWLQYFTNLNPMKYVLISVKGLFLKDMPFSLVWHNTWPLFIIGLVTLPIAGWAFTKRTE